MLVKMKLTERGAPDGIQVNTYEEGKTYDIPDSLGEVFVEENWATEVKSKKAKATANNPSSVEAANGATAAPVDEDGDED